MTYRNLLFLALSTLLIFSSCSDDGARIIVDEEPILDSIPKDPPQYGAPFAGIKPTDDLVMYEVNLRAQSASGDIQGVIDDLDRIKSLGVNVVWLMPIYPIGTINSVNSPYSISNYRQVNPEFGTIDDLRTLVEEAHARDMAVILDWVANHTAWDHPWVSDHKDWYTQNASGEIIIPAGTNWQDVADLNFTNSEMRHAMIRAMKFWILAANVDGYRCDAADFVPRAFWSQALDSLEAIPNRKLILLAEGARDDHFAAGFHMNYSWNFYTTLKSVFNGGSTASVFTTDASEYADIPEGKQKLRFTTNHDESAWDATPVSLFGGQKGALSAFVIATYLSGIPLIYGSQEIGVSATVPFFSNTTLNWSQNPDTHLAYQNIMAYYTTSATARTGEVTTHPATNILAFTKTGDEQVLVVVNPRNSTQVWTVPEALQNTKWINTQTDEVFGVETELSMEAYAYLILELE